MFQNTSIGELVDKSKAICMGGDLEDLEDLEVDLYIWKTVYY